MTKALVILSAISFVSIQSLASTASLDSRCFFSASKASSSGLDQVLDVAAKPIGDLPGSAEVYRLKKLDVAAILQAFPKEMSESVQVAIRGKIGKKEIDLTTGYIDVKFQSTLTRGPIVLVDFTQDGIRFQVACRNSSEK